MRTRSKQLQNILLRIAESGPRTRWGISIAALASYFPLQLLLHSLIGNSALEAAVIPGLIWAWLLGPRLAVLGIFLLALPNYFFFRILGALRTPEETLNFVADHFVFGVISYIVGYGYGLRRNLSRELAEREKSEARFRGLFERTHDAVFISDPNMIIVDVNDEAARLLGYTPKELIGMPYRDLVIPEQHGDLELRVGQSQAGDSPTVFERTYIRKDGSPITAEVTGALIRSSDGTPLHFQTISRDITVRKAAEEQLYYKATHDDMTGLYNRAMFFELLNRAVERTRRNQYKMAVLFLDLDGLKMVNDTHGHAMGDLLLKACAEKIITLLRKTDILARVGGDEFTIVLEGLADKSFAWQVAANIEQSLSEVFVLVGKQIEISTSVGISFFPGDAEDAEALVHKADQLMYAVKQEKNRANRK